MTSPPAAIHRSCLNSIDVVILAGGLGTRLRQVIHDRPKCMAEVHGRPYLERLLTQVEACGARRVILALGYMSSVVESFILSRPPSSMEVLCSVEPEARGTGGALRHALPHIRSDPVLVMNGDSYTDMNLCDLVRFHHSRGAELSMALTWIEGADRYGVVQIDSDGAVVSFSEKPDDRDSAGGQFINSGIYLVQRGILESIPGDRAVSLEREVFPSLCGQGLFALQLRARFIDIGTPTSFLEAQKFFPPETEVAAEDAE